MNHVPLVSKHHFVRGFPVLEQRVQPVRVDGRGEGVQLRRLDPGGVRDGEDDLGARVVTRGWNSSTVWLLASFVASLIAPRYGPPG
nr:hypothetical protein [Halostella litorea]